MVDGKDDKLRLLPVGYLKSVSYFRGEIHRQEPYGNRAASLAAQGEHIFSCRPGGANCLKSARLNV